MSVPAAATQESHSSPSCNERGGGMSGPASSNSSSSTPAPILQEHAHFTPMAMPPAFYANPFMSAYLPQGGAVPGSPGFDQAAANAAAASGGVPNPAYFMTPAGYQEMMQQYFQQMMLVAQQQASASTGNPAGSQMAGMPFPMPPSPFYPLQPESPFCVAPSQQTPPRPPSSTEGSERLSSGLGDLSLQETPEHLPRPRSPSAAAAAPASFESSPPRPVLVEAHPQAELLDEEVAGGSGSRESSEEAENAIAEAAARQQHLQMDRRDSSSSACSGTPSVSSSTTAATASDSTSKEGGKATEDEKTTNLIKKQMSEIEKEISRRTQNKNIKKIDDCGLAEFMGPSAAEVAAQQFVANFDAIEASSVTVTSSQSALPYTSTTSTSTTTGSTQPKESLNQLMNSFQIGSTSSAPSVPPPHSSAFSVAPTTQPPNHEAATAPSAFSPPQQFRQPQAAVPAPLVPPPPPAVTGLPPGPYQQIAAPSNRINPFTQPMQFPFHQAPPPHMLHNPQAFPIGFGLAGDPTAGMTTLPSTSSAPPNQPHPNGTPLNDWPAEENKENGSSGENGSSTAALNGDEPVWVLRDSYMKRLARDQQRAAAEQQETAWPEEQRQEMPAEAVEEEEETDRLLIDGREDGRGAPAAASASGPKKGAKETMVHEPAVLIEGVLFRARYLGSTQLSADGRGTKAARMAQAQEAVARVKAPEGEVQPGTDIDLFISTEKIMVLNTDLQRISDTDVRQDILMDHALRTISYIADIGDLVVLMARRMSHSNSDDNCNEAEGVRRAPRIVCHVFESDEAAFIAQSIGQAFQVAYVEFLRANGIDDPSYLRQIDYQEVLNSQELLGDELEMFARKETQKDVVVPKRNGEALGVVVVESGWGSMLPTVVLAHMSPTGPAARCNQLNVGDQIIAINGISLVGLPLSAAQTNIRNAKTSTAVRLTVVSTPPVVEVRIRRPDTKYQLGFSVQNGVICSLLRGGIAERGGIRVGHRIIEINHASVVAVAHERIVHMLATAVGDIHMKTMPTSMFRLLTGQEQPNYI